MIESDLSRIATALELIAAALSAKPVKAAKDTPAPVAVQAPVVAPVSTPVVAAPVVAAPVMPAAPFPVAATPVVPVVVPVVAAPVAPVVVSPSSPAVFSSKEEMTQFVINSYRALGAEKGAMIQGVLTAMGYANINDVDPARWGELKTGIEALAK